MQQRDWSTRPYKRKAGGVCTSPPGQYRHQLPHEIENAPGPHVAQRRQSQRVQIVSANEGSGRQQPPSVTIVPFLATSLKGRITGSVVTRANLEFVVDIFSRQILEIVGEEQMMPKRAPKKPENTRACSRPIKVPTTPRCCCG